MTEEGTRLSVIVGPGQGAQYSRYIGWRNALGRVQSESGDSLTEANIVGVRVPDRKSGTYDVKKILQVTGDGVTDRALFLCKICKTIKLDTKKTLTLCVYH